MPDPSLSRQEGGVDRLDVVGHSIPLDDDPPTPYTGQRQRDFETGWRACRDRLGARADTHRGAVEALERIVAIHEDTGAHPDDGAALDAVAQIADAVLADIRGQ